jgi:hypothetical protein
MSNREELDMKPQARPLAEIDRRIAEICAEKDGMERELADGKRKLKSYVEGITEQIENLNSNLSRLLQERGQSELNLKVED